jgi:type IV secretory pathway VirD2 relaxase
MSRRLLRVPDLGPSPVFQIVSQGRKGRHTALQLSRADIEAIARTVGSTPEVVVKVSGGGKSVAAVRAHVDYIDRHGKLALETDDGERLQGRQLGAWLVEDWNLALSRGQYREPKSGEQDRRPKVVHNLVFSMARGTPPEKLLAATRTFAREHFALRHRYAMVLHTDQDHPHVHVVVKAESEAGERLYIRKATLRQWRQDFAACLREQGVAANATPTAARGRVRNHKKDAIHQRIKQIKAYNALSAAERARRSAKKPVECRYLRGRVEAVAEALPGGAPLADEGKRKLLESRRTVVADWTEVAEQLEAQGERALAGQVRAMIEAMPPIVTEKERIAQGLLAQLRAPRALASNLDNAPSAEASAKKR